MKPKTRLLYSSILTAAFASQLQAADVTWTGATADFNTGTNWSTTPAIPAAGSTLVFGAAGAGGTTLNNDLTVGTSILGFRFDANAPAYTINGNSFNLTNSSPSFVVNSASNITQTINTSFLNLTLNTPWTVSGAGNLTLGGAMTNQSGWQGKLQMDGTGLLTLTGATGNNMNLVVNNGTVVLAKTAGVSAFGGYYGQALNGGTIKLGAADQLRAVNVGFAINGGTFDMNGFDGGVVSGSGVGTQGVTGGLQGLHGVGGVITNNDAGSGTNWVVIGNAVNNQTNIYGSYGGTIKDGATAKVGVTIIESNFQPNFQVLSGNNAYSGGTVIDQAYNGGPSTTLSISSLSSIGSAGNQKLNFVSANTGGFAVLQITGTAITNSSQFASITFTSGGMGLDIADQNNTFTLGTAVTTGAFRKAGAGTLVLTASNTYTGATNLLGGTLKVDYQSGGALGTSAPNFSGGNLYLLGMTSGTTSETLGNVTLSAGGGSLLVNPNNGTATNLTLGSLATSANAGSSLLIGKAASAGTGTVTITTTTNKDASGIIGGGRVVFTTDGGTTADWATTVSGGSPYTLSGYSGYTVGLPGSGSTATVNYSQADTASVTASESINTLKLTTTTTGQSLAITAGQTLTLTTGGLLFTGAHAYSITGGTLKSNTATNSDLIIHQYGAGNLTISSEIANGVGASTLTKAGTGTLTLGTANTYTGQTYVTGGTLSISANNQLGAFATGATVNLHGSGVLKWNAATSGTLDNGGGAKRAISIGSGGGGFDVVSSGNMTVSGSITATGMMTKSGAGILTLSAANTLNGGLTIQDGTLVQAADKSISNTNGGMATSNLIFGNGTAPKLQLNNFNASVTSLVSSNTAAIVENGGSTTNVVLSVYNGADNTFAGILQNGGGTKTLALAKTGGGTLTLSNAGNTFSGGITIYNGVLEGTQAGTLGSGTITLANGTMKAAGSFSNAITSSAGVSGAATSYLNNTIDTSAGNLSFSGVFSGSGALNKTGANTLTLGNAGNTYTGTLTATTGTVSFASMGSTVALVMAGGNFTSTGTTTVASLAVNSSGGNVTASANSLTLNSLTGSSNFSAIGTQYGPYVRLLGTNTGYSGVITAVGNFVLGSEAALGTNTDALTLNGAMWDNGSTLTVASHRITLSAGGNTLNGNMNLTGGLTGAGGIRVRSATSGVIVVGGTTNDFAGGVEIYTDDGNNSTLRLGANETLPSGSGKGNLQLTAWSTGTARLDMGGYSQTVNGLTSAGSTAATKTIIDNVSAGGTVTLTVGANNATGYTFAGVIKNTSGTLNIEKTGTGTQILSGTNTYSGSTTVKSGKFTIDTTGTINGTSGVTMGTVSTAAISQLNYNSSTALTKSVLFAASSTGGTVSGSGTIDPALIVTSGNTYTPGEKGAAGAQTLTGGITFNSGSTFQWDIGISGGSETGHDMVTNTGGLAGSGAVFDVVLGTGAYTDTFWNANKSWNDVFSVGTLASVFSSITGTGVIWDSGTSRGNVAGEGYFTMSTNTLSWTAVPEPGSALAGLLVGAGLLRRRRTA